MTSYTRAFQYLWPILLASGVAWAEPAPEAVHTRGIYRSEIQTNAEGTSYISVLRFAEDRRVFLTHVAMPATQERLCGWFRPELERNHWAKGASYSLEGNRITFQTASPSATTLFDGTVESEILRLQLVVPAKQNLTYPLTFRYASCP